MDTHMTTRRTLALAAAAVALLAALLLPSAGTVSAHHPEVSGTTTCTDTGWTVTWTARPDANRPQHTWWIVSPDGYSPSGAQQATLANTFTRTATYPHSQASATESVQARWSNGAQGTRTGTAQRPQDCTAPTTTTTTTSPPTTTTTTTTTTVAPTTTTTTVLPPSSTTVPTTDPSTTTSTVAVTTPPVPTTAPPTDPPTTPAPAAPPTTAPPTTVSPELVELPATGTGTTLAAAIAALLLAAGLGAVYVARRD